MLGKIHIKIGLQKMKSTNYLKLKKIIIDLSFFIISGIIVLLSISLINKYLNKISDDQEKYKIYVEFGIYAGTVGLTLFLFFASRLLKKLENNNQLEKNQSTLNLILKELSGMKKEKSNSNVEITEDELDLR